MYSAYKKLTAQDIGQVPFNAYKQYNFDSSSFSSSSLEIYTTTWSSASIYSFSTGALGGVYPPADTANSLRYFQLDHIFYKDWKLNLNERLGHIHYLKHKRELHKDSKIVSIPNGLCGGGIKPSTFNLYLSGSGFSEYNLIDDSYGNLYISGSNLSDYNTDIRSNILKIGPEKGFKKYDLNVINDEFEAGLFYRRGKKRINTINSLTKESIIDDSYFFNLLNYKNITLSPQPLIKGTFSGIDFNGVNSGIDIENDEKFHFNPGDDFTISLWANVSQSSTETSYLISKSTTQTVIPSTHSHRNAPTTTYTTGSNQTKDVPSSPQFPFEIYSTGNKVYFSRSDGDNTFIISSSLSTGSMQHITCRVTSSQLEIFINGVGSGISGSETFERDTQNKANVYIGSKGGNENFLSGSLSQINIYDTALTDVQVLNHYNNSNSSPYVGNIFYESGIATLTHPGYYSNPIENIKFQGTHLIYENEYQCTLEEHEFNYTLNTSARKNKNLTCQDIASFATGSNFKPYVTTVGLYNEEGEMLVVGKLGQPTRMSDETDTTIIIRWDK